MRICLIYQADFPPSERIEKTARALAADGHEVFLVCNNYGKFTDNEQRVGPLDVVRIRPTFRSRTVNRLLKFPIFVNPLWIAQLLAAIRRLDVDALQVIDIPLAVAVLIIGRLRRLPVILDMWENYPEALRGWAQTDWKTRIFKNYRVARAVERWVVRRVDHVFTVVEESRDRLIARGVPADRVSVVTNGVEMEMFAGPDRQKVMPEVETGAYILLYVGAITTERGLEDIIRALPLVRPRIPRIRFYIAGSGNDEARLRKIADTAGVTDLVRFLGWLRFEQIHSYVLSSDLCVVPHVYNEFINSTVPNKLFQYMIMAKPVLVSHAKPLARIVRECSCGFVFQSGNPANAADKIVEAYEKRSDSEIGERGRRAALRQYTWEMAARDLLGLYRRLESERTLKR